VEGIVGARTPERIYAEYFTTEDTEITELFLLQAVRSDSIDFAK